MQNYEETFVTQYINRHGGLADVDTAVAGLLEYVNGDYYDSKTLRILEWGPDKGELFELVIAVFTLCLLNDKLTYPCISGMIAGRIDLEDNLEQVKTAAEVIAVISKSGLITIEKSGRSSTMLVSTPYQIDTEIPRVNKHLPPMEKPKKVEANYDYDQGRLLLGGKIKFHEKDICLEHLDRMNGIQLKLNRPLLRSVSNEPTFDMDTREKRQQWRQFIENSYVTLVHVAKNGNRFYLNHKYDNRGRCHAVGYHINTQGTSFQKACVQLAKEEIVTK